MALDCCSQEAARGEGFLAFQSRKGLQQMSTTDAPALFFSSYLGLSLLNPVFSGSAPCGGPGPDMPSDPKG